MNDFLNKVIAQKKIEVAQLKVRQSKSLKKALSTPRAIIAEIKRTSPANGVLASIPDPVALATTYQEAGASVISVLTDHPFFNGSMDDLRAISHALRHTPCVILRKEFIIDPIQLIEASHAGADAVLLIVAALQSHTQSMITQARDLGLEVLLEVHTEDELRLALSTNADIIGINNRNLSTLAVDVQTSHRLRPLLPDHVITVSESGIHDASTATELFESGFHALLIGEALVTSDDPKKLIHAMRGITP